jgi:hypothetical protein
MMPFDQGLELRLDIGAFGVGFKTKNIKRAALCIENLAPLRRGARMTALKPPFTAQRERIVSRPARSAKALCRAAGAFATERAHFPGRAVPRQRFLLVFGNRLLAHAGEEIV